jgi:plasmid maintenance system antidote protein VapI
MQATKKADPRKPSGLKREATVVARTAKTIPRAAKDGGAAVARASTGSVARVSSARGVDAAAFLERKLGRLTLGKTVASIREGEEMSLAAFAVKLGTTAAKVSDIEHGRRHLGLRRAAEWARALGYSEAQFVRLALQEMVDEEGLDLEVRVASR